MNAKELRDLIEFLVEKDIAEFELERGELKVRMKRGNATHVAPVVVAAPVLAPAPQVGSAAPAAPPSAATPSAAPAAPAEAPDSDADLHIVRSPIVGTFYESPSPGAPPFVKVGDSVS